MVTARFPRAGEGRGPHSSNGDSLQGPLPGRESHRRRPGRRLAALWLRIGRVLLWGGYGLALGAAVGLVLGLIRAGAAEIAPAVLEGALAGLCVGTVVGLHASGRTVEGAEEDGHQYFS